MSTNYGADENWLNISKANSLNGLITSNLTYAIDFARPLSFTSSSNTVNDLAGSNVVATFVDRPIFNPEQPYEGLLFDGSNDYLSLANGGNTSTPIVLSTDCSVYIWAKFTSSGEIGMFCHWSGGPVNVGFGANSGKMHYKQYDGQWNYYTSNGASINTGKWVHLAWIRTSSTRMLMYVNGSIDYSLNVVSPRYLGGGNMGSIGTWWSWGYFPGRIGMLQVYNGAAHSSTEVLSQFKAHRNRYGV